VWEGDAIRWRPTVGFIYRPCDDALVSMIDCAGAGWTAPQRMRVLLDEVVYGEDELGVLLMGSSQGAFWFGSRLSAVAARGLVSSCNATSLQVAAGVLGGLVWVLENPRAGLREPDDVDHVRILEVAQPYLGELKDICSDWTPRAARTDLFPEDADFECPWQFRNFRVG